MGNCNAGGFNGSMSAHRDERKAVGDPHKAKPANMEMMKRYLLNQCQAGDAEMCPNDGVKIIGSVEVVSFESSGSASLKCKGESSILDVGVSIVCRYSMGAGRGR